MTIKTKTVNREKNHPTKKKWESARNRANKNIIINLVIVLCDKCFAENIFAFYAFSISASFSSFNFQTFSFFSGEFFVLLVAFTLLCAWLLVRKRANYSDSCTLTHSESQYNEQKPNRHEKRHVWFKSSIWSSRSVEWFPPK